MPVSLLLAHSLTRWMFCFVFLLFVLTVFSLLFFFLVAHPSVEQDIPEAFKKMTSPRLLRHWITWFKYSATRPRPLMPVILWLIDIPY